MLHLANLTREPLLNARTTALCICELVSEGRVCVLKGYGLEWETSPAFYIADVTPHQNEAEERTVACSRTFLIKGPVSGLVPGEINRGCQSIHPGHNYIMVSSVM